MFDRLFPAILTLSVLAGGTIAFASELIAPKPTVLAARAIVHLPAVEVVGKAVQPAASVAMAATESVRRAQ